MSNRTKIRTRWIRFNLVELFLLVALIAGGFAIYIAFWNPKPNASNYEIFVGIYLAVFSVATVGAVPWKPVARRPVVAFIVFGWTFLVFILLGSGEHRTISNAIHLAHNMRLGLSLACFTAVAARLIFSRTSFSNTRSANASTEDSSLLDPNQANGS